MTTQKVDQEPGALDRQVAGQKKAARNRRAGTFAAAVVLVVIAVAAYALTRTPPRGVPAHSTSVPHASGSTLDLRSGAVTPLPASIAASGTYYAVSPDHSKIAYNACCSAVGPVMVANVDGTGVHALTAQGWDAYGAQWSPDGAKLVYQQRDGSTQLLGNLFVLNVATGRRTQLTHFDQSQQWGLWFTFPSFASDGKWILFQLPRGNPSNPTWDLWTVSVAGGEPSLVRRNAGWGGLRDGPFGSRLAYLSPINGLDFTGGKLWVNYYTYDTRGITPAALSSLRGSTGRSLVLQAAGLSWPRWSPDETRIAYRDGGSIYVVDVATGSTTRVARGGNPEWFDNHTLTIGNATN